MKRIKIILLLCFTVFVLCGCSKKDKASEIKGKIEGNEYVNTFANIRIKAPDGFTFLSE